MNNKEKEKLFEIDFKKDLSEVKKGGLDIEKMLEAAAGAEEVIRKREEEGELIYET